MIISLSLLGQSIVPAKQHGTRDQCHPYIFTFKLWDWGRLGLDGLPRPIHIDRGRANIVWSRDTAWVQRNLINRIEPIGDGPAWREERTGLHELQFIETRRHWFTGPTPHDTSGTVNVINLVEGMEATAESPNGSFDRSLSTMLKRSLCLPQSVNIQSGPVETRWATGVELSRHLFEVASCTLVWGN